MLNYYFIEKFKYLKADLFLVMTGFTKNTALRKNAKGELRAGQLRGLALGNRE